MAYGSMALSYLASRSLPTPLKMPFPLPLDPEFRKEIIQSWIDDVADRVELGDIEGAEKSWQAANLLYIQLPAGKGDLRLKDHLLAARVKLREYHSIKPNANSI
jgi:hypothetical protein